MGDTNGGYQFGGWLVEPQLNRVSRGSEVHQLEPRTMDVLSHLLEHAGQLVTSNELLDRFWEGRSGEPGMISKRVGQIRQTLGDDTKQPTYIETIARRGYRTVAPVAEIADPGLPTDTPFTRLHELHEEGQAADGTPGHRTEANHTRSGVAHLSNVKRRAVLLVAAGCAVVGLALGWIAAQWWPGSQASKVSRYVYGLAPEEEMVATFGVSIAISPDGARIAYIGPAEGSTQIWIRERDRLRGRPVPGTEGAWHPLFAPRGPGIGFITGDGKLKVKGKVGDPPLTLADDAWSVFGADWATDGHIYYSATAGLKRVMAGGGTAPELVAALDPESERDIASAFPDVLPNGKGVLFTIWRNHIPSEVAVVDLSTGKVRVLARGVLGRYATSRYLAYVREDGSLMTAPFDPDRLELTGDSVLGVDRLPPGLLPDIALSESGSLIYATRPEQILELVWVDRDGTWLSIDPDNPIRNVRYAALSADGSLVAVNTWNRRPSDEGQLWVKHLPRGAISRFTFDGTVNMRPTWTPDGRSIMYISDRGGNRDVWVKQADGIKDAERLLDYEMDIDEAFYSPDGEWIVHRRGMHVGERDILAIRAALDSPAIPLLSSSFDEQAPALSPDGRWLAYVSDRGAQYKYNVYVRPFPGVDTETIVSVDGGTEPVWARDGSELFYRNGAGEMVAVAVVDATEFKLGDAQVLFATGPYHSDVYHATYDVSADGQRFLMSRETESESRQEELVVVENWIQEIGTTTVQ